MPTTAFLREIERHEIGRPLRLIVTIEHEHGGPPVDQPGFEALLVGERVAMKVFADLVPALGAKPVHEVELHTVRQHEPDGIEVSCIDHRRLQRRLDAVKRGFHVGIPDHGKAVEAARTRIHFRVALR